MFKDFGLKEELNIDKKMVDKEVKNVHREPHPFVGMNHLGGFIGKTIAFVGRVSEIKD